MYFILFYFIFTFFIGNMLTFVHLTIHMTHFYKCDFDKNIMLVEKKTSGKLTGIDLRETAYQSDAYSTGFDCAQHSVVFVIYLRRHITLN